MMKLSLPDLGTVLNAALLERESTKVTVPSLLLMFLCSSFCIDLLFISGSRFIALSKENDIGYLDCLWSSFCYSNNRFFSLTIARCFMYLGTCLIAFKMKNSRTVVSTGWTPTFGSDEKSLHNALSSSLHVMSTLQQLVYLYESWSFSDKQHLALLSVLFTLVETFLANALVGDLLREDGKHLPKVHKHLLFNKYFPTSRGNCVVCNQSIKGERLYCELCRVHICLKCASDPNVDTKLEDIIRSDKGPKNEPRFSSFQYFVKAMLLVRPHLLLLLLALSSVLLSTFLAFLLPIYHGAILDQLSTAGVEFSSFKETLKWYVVLLVLQGLASACNSGFFKFLGGRLEAELRDKFFQRILQQDVAYFDGSTTERIAERLNTSVSIMFMPIEDFLPQLIQGSLFILAGIVKCFSTSFELSMLIVVIVSPLSLLWEKYSTYVSAKSFIRRWARADARKLAGEAIRNIRVVKYCGSESEEVLKYSQQNHMALVSETGNAIAVALNALVAHVLDAGLFAVIFWFGLSFSDNGQKLSVGDLISFQMYWSLISTSYQKLTLHIPHWASAYSYAEHVLSLYFNEPDIKPDTGMPVDWNVQGDIELAEVVFYYQMRPETAVLNNLSLKIKSGTTCALVGASGSGKSTVIDLMVRLYGVKGGNIYIDGREYSTLNVKQLRSCFAVVPQDTFLWSQTILYNLTYGRKPGSYTEEEVFEAARKAQAHDFIMSMKDGYNTYVGEQGGRLSGGQKQRIAIARAFLRKPKIVLLDEATSNLDEASQNEVQCAIDDMIQSGNYTIIVVAHRLSTIKTADKIAVLERGKIVEEGSHEDLMKASGAYAQLYNVQAK